MLFRQFVTHLKEKAPAVTSMTVGLDWFITHRSSYPCVTISLNYIVFSKEIRLVPIHNLYFGFLCRMDIKLVEYHYILLP